MSTYHRFLPQMFPYALSMSRSNILLATTKLLSARTDVLAGSSFCVTSGVLREDRKMTLWLSETSARFLTGNGNGLPGRVTQLIREAMDAAVRRTADFEDRDPDDESDEMHGYGLRMT